MCRPRGLKGGDRRGVKGELGEQEEDGFGGAGGAAQLEILFLNHHRKNCLP